MASINLIGQPTSVNRGKRPREAKESNERREVEEKKTADFASAAFKKPKCCSHSPYEIAKLLEDWDWSADDK